MMAALGVTQIAVLLALMILGLAAPASGGTAQNQYTHGRQFFNPTALIDQAQVVHLEKESAR